MVVVAVKWEWCGNCSGIINGNMRSDIGGMIDCYNSGESGSGRVTCSRGD